MSTVSSVSPRRPSPVVSPAPPQIARWGLLVLLVGAFVAESVCARVEPEYETDPEYGDGRRTDRGAGDGGDADGR